MTQKAEAARRRNQQPQAQATGVLVYRPVSSRPHWDVERMRSVVLEWDAALRAEMPAYARLVPEAEERRSVLRPPATPDEIVDAERRLGVQLPPSYRSFLLIANGADAGPSRANCMERLFPPQLEGLLSIGEVGRDEGLVWLVNMWRDEFKKFADRQGLPSPDRPVEVYDFEPGSDALLVTRPGQDQYVGLVPFPGEWQVWEFFHEHVTAHESFAAFLQYHAREARRRLAEREKRARDARADGSSVRDAWDLAEHGDPRAIDAATRALLRSPHITLVHKLQCLGDPTAIPALRVTLRRLDDPESPDILEGLTPKAVGVPHEHLQAALLRALDSCGDPEIVDELKRRAARSPEGFAAKYLATRDELPRW